MKVRNAVPLWALLLLLLSAVGCGGGASALDPRFQPEVTNAPDNFQFQTTAITNVTERLTYTWQNTGIRASINQASSVTAGVPMLHLRDANGTLVYSGDLRSNGTFTSIAGTAGSWTIEVELTNVSGTLNFRVQKAP